MIIINIIIIIIIPIQFDIIIFYIYTINRMTENFLR